jgi:phosphoglycerate kinase
MSHLGRPKGEVNPELSLAPVARHLSALLDTAVTFVPATVGGETERQVSELPSGSIVVLENTRFHPGEKKNDVELAAEMARLGDVYVNDAFGTAHRAHASTVGVTAHFSQSAMGYLLAAEVENLSRLMSAPARPFVAVLGGAKVSDKIGVIEQLLEKADHLLIGGAMSYTFMKMLGQSVGTSLVEEDKLDEAKRIYDLAGDRLHLPSDHVVAATFGNEAERSVVEENIPTGFMGLDIGPQTIATYRSIIMSAGTVAWNGPMGVFEMSNFAEGTLGIGRAIADATERGAFSVVGGGDSVAAVTKADLTGRISHVSTGGGAMLEFLEGKELPGIAALTRK